MGLFSRRKKNNKETNEIDNKQLKKQLCDSAIGTLIEGEEYNNLKETVCQFGYLFLIKNHGLESLFKVNTDLGTFYFTAQGDSVMRVNFNEELFEETTDRFLTMHE